jgi:hypothetical protein
MFVSFYVLLSGLVLEYTLYESATKYLAPKLAGPLLIASCLLAAPVLMASQNWDDHDRSGKYTAVAMAKLFRIL